MVNSPEQRTPERRTCDGGACDDACARCAPEAHCELGAAGAVCVCPDGFDDPRGDGSRCAADDACTEDDDCGAGGRCVERVGGAVCGCAEGYELQAGRCRNLDECARGTHDCGEGAVCVDRPGGFACACRDGYAEAGDGERCENVDECARGACGERALCTDTPGGYTCACPLGYEGDPHSSCRDSDECARGLLQCEAPAVCRERDGPDRCACPRYLGDRGADATECVDDRIQAGFALTSTGVRLASAPPFGESLDPLDERMVVFADGDTQPACERVYFALDEEPSGESGVLRLELDAQGACAAAEVFDRPLYLELPFGVTGDARGGWATLGAREDAGSAGRRCELTRIAPLAGYRLSDLPCPVAPASAAAARAALRRDGAGDLYLLLHHDGAGVVGALPVAAPVGQGVLLARIAAGEAQWVSAFAGDGGTAAVSVEAFAVDAEGNSYLYGRSDAAARLGGAGVLAGPASFLVSFDRGGAPRFRRSSEDDGGLPSIRALAAGAEGELVALVAAGSEDRAVVELVRLDPSDGAALFRREIGRGPVLAPERIALDAAGNAVITGVLAGAVRLGDEWHAAGDAAALRPFVAAFDRDGAIRFGHVFGAEALVDLVDLAVQPSGAIYLAARFTPPADFGGGVTAETGSHVVLLLRP